MEIFLAAILTVLAVFFCWDVSERLHSGIAVLLNPPESLPGTQLPGYVTGNVIVIMLLTLGVFGILEKNIWMYAVASISYLLGGLGESMRRSKSRIAKSTANQNTSDEARVLQEKKVRSAYFILRLSYRYILPILLGFVWFTLQA